VAAAKASVFNTVSDSYVNFFSVLKLEPVLELDETLLETKFRQQQSLFHPDRFVKASPEEKSRAAVQASLINDAYTSLKSKLTRAQHLLLLAGEDVIVHQQHELLPEDLLQQMQWREKLELAVQLQGDHAEQSIENLQKEVVNSMQNQWEQFAPALKKDLPLARQLFFRLQFSAKLLQEIRKVEDKLLD
jgi:molecular chaperone HscB